MRAIFHPGQVSSVWALGAGRGSRVTAARWFSCFLFTLSLSCLLCAASPRLEHIPAFVTVSIVASSRKHSVAIINK